MMRTIAAFIVAPFPVACFQAIVVGLWPKAGKGIFEHPSSMFFALNLYFYIFGLLLGLPLWLLLRRRTSLRRSAMVGAFVGLVPVGAVLIVMTLRGQASAYLIVYTGMLFGLGGMAAGVLYWRVAVRKKPSTDLGAVFN